MATVPQHEAKNKVTAIMREVSNASIRKEQLTAKSFNAYADDLRGAANILDTPKFLARGKLGAVDTLNLLASDAEDIAKDVAGWTKFGKVDQFVHDLSEVIEMIMR